MRKLLLAFLVLGLVSCSSSDGTNEGDLGFAGSDADLMEGEGVLDLTCQTSDTCPGNLPYCHVGEKVCVECTKNEQCPTEKAFCNAQKHACAECVMDVDCGEGRHCLDGTCSDKACWPDSKVCVGNSVHICSADGMNPHSRVEDCVGQTCYNGDCLACVPDQTSCKENQVIECDSEGASFEVLEDCGVKECIGNQCVFCYPGNKECDGNNSMICGEDGEHWELSQNCSDNGFTCVNGTCVSPCAADIKQNTNAGCEFYAVDLHNALENSGFGVYDAQNAQFAVIASNTSDTAAATVTVTLPNGTTQEQVVAPGALGKFLLPPEYGIAGTEVSMKAYKVSANLPITVYQFNPLSNEQVFSNDASVLLPTPAVGKEYYVASYQGEGYASYFVIVGVSSVPIELTFTVTANTAAGGGIPALAPGQSHTMTVEQGQVIAVEATATAGEDLTGSYILATGPVMVFGGHTAASTGDRCCADHLEQQMAPVNTWGVKYVVTKTWPRMLEKDYVRVVAAKDGTAVTVFPAIASVPVLNAGEHYTFRTDRDIEVSSADPTKPIMVVQYLASSYEILGDNYTESCYDSSDCPPDYECDYFYGQCMGGSCYSNNECPSGHSCSEGYCAPTGDPTMILAVPAEQFMESYVFLTPDAYLLDYINIIVPLNAQTVVLDGNQIAPNLFTPIGNSGYGVHRTKVADGSHTVWSDKKINIVVYGYDDDVSYGYPGGLGLKDIGD
jgi:hypothetical protein